MVGIVVSGVLEHTGGALEHTTPCLGFPKMSHAPEHTGGALDHTVA